MPSLPNTGQACARVYSGLYHTYRLYCSGPKNFFQALLIDSLIEGCYYQFSVYLRPYFKQFLVSETCDPHHYSFNSLQFCFTPNAIKDRRAYNATNSKEEAILASQSFHDYNLQPQLGISQNTFITDTTRYTLFRTTFKADGNHKYITIGNFRPVTQTRVYSLSRGDTMFIHETDSMNPFVAGFYMDDLELIKVPPPDSLLKVSDDFNICPGDTAIITAEAKEADSLLWDSGEKSLQLEVSDSGYYKFTAYYGCGNTLSDSVYVSLTDTSFNRNFKDTALCRDGAYELNLPDKHNYKLNGLKIKPGYIINKPDKYVLLVEDSCYVRQFNFEIRDSSCELKVFVPNAFTPNMDGLNDCFEISTTDITYLQLRIFNRWGEQVYFSETLNQCWDGTYKGSVVTGIFTYSLLVEDDRGKSFRKKGSITVFR